MLRQQLYNIIEHDNGRQSTSSKTYDIIMFAAIVFGVFPLMFRAQYPIFRYCEIVACVVFIFDYLARWITADYRSAKSPLQAFLRYPFTPWAIIDLLTILPGLNLLGRAFVTLRVARLFKVFRMFRLFKYSKQITLLFTVLRKESKVLLSVLILAVFYIFFTALIMFNTEDSFENFFDSLYWATTALTTVGYGDICPKTDIGRLISMLSSLFGVAVIALPSGIVTAGYLNEIKKMEAESLIITTEDELQGFYIVRSILAREIRIARITQRDAQNYFDILLDDNNMKPICRLYFNSSNKYIATFDDQKKETKHLLGSLNDIYEFTDLILATVRSYETT